MWRHKLLRKWPNNLILRGKVMHKLQVKVLDPRIGDSIPMPEYATTGSAGLDLRACIDSPITLKPGETQLIRTGLSIYIEDRSEEHTSELQSRPHLVCRLLLEKKK